MAGKLGGLFKDSVIYGLSRYLGALMSFFLLPIYTRILDPLQYGEVELYSTLLSTLSVFAILGLDSAIALVYYDIKEDRLVAASTAFWMRLALSVTLALMAALAAPLLSQWLFHSVTASRIDLIHLVLFSLPFSMLQAFCLDYLRLRLQPWRYTIVNLGGIVISTVLGFALVVGMRAGAPGLVAANAIGSVVSGCLAFLMVRDGVSIKFSRPIAKRMLSFGLPLVPAAFATWVIGYGDRYYMTHYLDLTQIGIYSIALKIASIATLATSAFQLAWGPFIFAIQNEPDAKETYARVLKYYLLIAVSMALLMGLFAPELLALFAGKRYAGGGSVAGLMVMVPVIVGLYYIFSIGINLTAKTTYASLTTMLAAFASVLLNALFIPHWGIVGAALANLVAQAVSATALYFVSQRFYPIPFDYRGILVIYGLWAGAIGASMAFEHSVPWTLPAKLAIACAYFGSLGLTRLYGHEERQALSRGLSLVSSRLRLGIER